MLGLVVTRVSSKPNTYGLPNFFWVGIHQFVLEENMEEHRKVERSLAQIARANRVGDMCHHFSEILLQRYRYYCLWKESSMTREAFLEKYPGSPEPQELEELHRSLTREATVPSYLTRRNPSSSRVSLVIFVSDTGNQE